MRYRVKNYEIESVTAPTSTANGSMTIKFPLPVKVGLDTDTDKLIESIRLVIDETKLIVACSSMQKSLITNSSLSTDASTGVQSASLTLSTGTKTAETTDKMTIEIDLGIDLETIDKKLGEFADDESVESILSDMLEAYTEHKTLIVEALNTIGITATTSDSWIVLASKISNIVSSVTPMTSAEVQEIFERVTGAE